MHSTLASHCLCVSILLYLATDYLLVGLHGEGETDQMQVRQQIDRSVVYRGIGSSFIRVIAFCWGEGSECEARHWWDDVLNNLGHYLKSLIFTRSPDYSACMLMISSKSMMFIYTTHNSIFVDQIKVT